MRNILYLGLVMAKCRNGRKGRLLVYVGTYTGENSKGIYAFRMNKEGKLAPLGLVAETPAQVF